MENFDADKIKDMEYDPSRGRYVAKDGREFKSTPYSNGTGYKYDYYGSTTYKNAKHNSTHVKSDLNENWTRTDNNRDDNTSNSSKGSGCYLTTACMKYYLSNFDDTCHELSVLRWFRDNFVSNEDIEHYYNTAPYIVEGIEKEDNKDIVYDYIYDNVVDYCVNAIENGNYIEAYKRYKDSIINLEQLYARKELGKRLIKTLN